MLSYVMPQEATAPVAERNLNLNLSSQYEQATKQTITNASTAAAAVKAVQTSEVDIMLANNITSESCDERTQLLTKCSTPPRPRRQNSNNNNNGSITNNNNSTVASESDGRRGEGGGGGIGDGDYETADSDISDKQPNPNTRQITKKPKLSKLGAKTVGLKRVSFGSSKGSMVETLVFETPTPLSEHVEPTFGFECDTNAKTPINYSIYTRDNMDDSGIEVQEESERSIVRVSIYQSNQPQQICPPDYYTRFEDNLDNSFSNCNHNLEDIMATVSTIPGYDRQQSTDSGWDNPFRPGGDLSREADEIVNMIRGGKPITPTEDHSLGNGKAQREENCNGTTTSVENVTKTNITQTQSAQNGTNTNPQRVQQSTSKSPENNGVTSLAQVSKQVVPGPTSASHVVIDEKKNKKKGCCVIQ